jgi:hypothetical protein
MPPSYRKRPGENFYRVRYRQKGQIRYTGRFPSREYAEKWSRRWRRVAGEMAQVIFEITPVPQIQVTPRICQAVEGPQRQRPRQTIHRQPEAQRHIRMLMSTLDLPVEEARRRMQTHRKSKLASSQPVKRNYIIDEYGAKQTLLI